MRRKHHCRLCGNCFCSGWKRKLQHRPLHRASSRLLCVSFPLLCALPVEVCRHLLLSSVRRASVQPRCCMFVGGGSLPAAQANCASSCRRLPVGISLQTDGLKQRSIDCACILLCFRTAGGRLQPPPRVRHPAAQSPLPLPAARVGGCARRDDAAAGGVCCARSSSSSRRKAQPTALSVRCFCALRHSAQPQRQTALRGSSEWIRQRMAAAFTLSLSLALFGPRRAKQSRQREKSDSQMKRNSTLVDQKAHETYIYLISITISSLPATC